MANFRQFLVSCFKNRPKSESQVQNSARWFISRNSGRAELKCEYLSGSSPNSGQAYVSYFWNRSRGKNRIWISVKSKWPMLKNRSKCQRFQDEIFWNFKNPYCGKIRHNWIYFMMYSFILEFLYDENVSISINEIWALYYLQSFHYFLIFEVHSRFDWLSLKILEVGQLKFFLKINIIEILKWNFGNR